MTRQDIAAVAVVALATAVVALGVGFTGRLVAEESPKAEIPWPVLKHGAVEITLRGPKADLAPGDDPAAELETVNNGSDSDTILVTLSLVSQPSATWGGRTLPVAREVWKQEVKISLGGGERKKLSFTANAKAPANTLLSFRLAAGKNSVATPPRAVKDPGSSLQVPAHDTILPTSRPPLIPAEQGQTRK